MTTLGKQSVNGGIQKVNDAATGLGEQTSSDTRPGLRIAGTSDQKELKGGAGNNKDDLKIEQRNFLKEKEELPPSRYSDKF